MNLSNKVTKYIKEQNLLQPNSTVVLGVSGGVDSIALLHFFHFIREKMNLQLVVAHIDHMFRGEESYEDFLFVKNTCVELNVIFEGVQINVPAYKEKHKLNSQVAARECRYTFFEEIMERYQANYLVLAHHGDDQVETLLMKLIRGTITPGQVGMPVSRSFASGTLIRPFLCVEKEELQSYCQENNYSYRHDSSNDLNTYQRNRLRKMILPVLKDENPKVHERFLFFNQQIQEDENYLQELSYQEMNNVIKNKNKDEVVLSISKLLSLPKSLQWRGIHLILSYLYNGDTYSLSSIHIEAILSLFSQSDTGAELSLPRGLKVIRSYSDGKFTFEAGEPSPFFYSLKENDAINRYFWKIIIHEGMLLPPINKENYFIMKKPGESFSIKVRNAKQGDRIKIPGLNGTKKVNRLFIDKKVPRDEREKWPIVTDNNDEILWIPGLQKSIYEIQDICIDDFVVIEYIRY